MAIMRVTPPPTTVRTGTRCPDEGAKRHPRAVVRDGSRLNQVMLVR